MENQQKNRRKMKKGTVVSDKMDKTVVVRVDRTMRHPVYQKVITRSRKYYAHDESNQLKNGDEVTIVESRPFSKLKRWCVVNQ